MLLSQSTFNSNFVRKRTRDLEISEQVEPSKGGHLSIRETITNSKRSIMKKFFKKVWAQGFLCGPDLQWVYDLSVLGNF